MKLPRKKNRKASGGAFKSGDPRIARGFQPGKSGNPGGRPKNPFPEMIRKATKDGAEIVQGVLRIFRNSPSDKTKLWAAEWLRDTGWHKPVQGIRGMDDDGNDTPLRIEYVRE